MQFLRIAIKASLFQIQKPSRDLHLHLLLQPFDIPLFSIWPRELSLQLRVTGGNRPFAEQKNGLNRGVLPLDIALTLFVEHIVPFD